MSIDYGSERAGKIGKRINRIELTGLYRRRDYRPILCPSIVARKESILTVQSYWAGGPLDGIVVDLYAAVGQEDTEAIPVFGDIGECFVKRRLASNAGTMIRELGPHAADQWR